MSFRGKGIGKMYAYVESDEVSITILLVSNTAANAKAEVEL